MRRTLWRVVSLVMVLGLSVLSCTGANRSVSVTGASGFRLIVTASPNTLRGATAGTGESQGGCAAIQVTVFDEQGRLVDGVLVALTTTLGRFPPTPTRAEAVGVAGFTRRGVFADVLCAKSERGTAIVTATVDDAVSTVQITIF